MFDLTSSKLLILGIVALIVVGPKDLPVLLRTLGRYVGMIRRHAAEFRAQFDEAIRESELDQLKKEVETVRGDMTRTFDEAQSSMSRQLESVKSDVDSALGDLDAHRGEAEAPSSPEPSPAPAEPATTDAGPTPATAEARLDAPQPAVELPKVPVTPHPGIHDMKSGA